MILELKGEQLITVGGSTTILQLFGASFGRLGSFLSTRAGKARVPSVISQTQLGLLPLPLLHFSTLGKHRQRGIILCTHKGTGRLYAGATNGCEGHYRVCTTARKVVGVIGGLVFFTNDMLPVAGEGSCSELILSFSVCLSFAVSTCSSTLSNRQQRRRLL